MTPRLHKPHLRLAYPLTNSLQKRRVPCSVFQGYCFWLSFIEPLGFDYAVDVIRIGFNHNSPRYWKGNRFEADRPRVDLWAGGLRKHGQDAATASGRYSEVNPGAKAILARAWAPGGGRSC